MTYVVGTWDWLRKADLKVQTEALLCAAQEQALWTNSVLELITQVATQTVPNRAAMIKIWHNQSVINLNGSFFQNKGSHTFEGTYS